MVVSIEVKSEMSVETCFSAEYCEEVSVMKGKLSRLTWRSLVGIAAVLVLGFSLGTRSLKSAQQDDGGPEARKAEARVVADFTVTLQPDVLHGFVLGPASLNRGFVVEVSPLTPAADGAFVTSFVEPETNGIVWIDVVRLKLGAASAPIDANIRVYALVPKTQRDN